jgi:Tol biopolymer transport system component
MRVSITGCALAALAAAIGCHDSAEPVTPPETMLSPRGVEFARPMFSPDGGRVAYWVPSSNGEALTVANADLTGAVVLDTASAIVTAWSPGGDQLAYTAGMDNDIWIVDVAGGSRRQLTTGTGIEQVVQWSPSGKRLLMIATGAGGKITTRILTLATKASVPLAVGAGFAIPSWAPDGSRMAYTLIEGDRTTIWVADSDGGHPRQLTHEGFERLEQFPAQPWSPDGKELLYTSTRTGLADVWALPVDGDSARQLTRDVRSDDQPAWSPDGRWVAFVSTRGGQTDVWMVPAAGGTPVRVTDDAEPESFLQWVGRGTKVAFSVTAIHNGIWTHSLTGGAERRLTPDSMHVGDWVLSPDGRTLAVQSGLSGGTADIVLIPVSGGSPRTLVANGANNFNVRWSPDGSRLAFLSDRTGNQDVWVVDTAGGAPTDLTNWPGREGAPEWSTDGRSIYFTSDRDARPLADLWKIPATGGTAVRLTHAGTAQFEVVNPKTGDVLIAMLNGPQGQPDLERLTPAGKLERISGNASVNGFWNDPFTPDGDTIAVEVLGAHGANRTVLMPTRGGTSRPLGPPTTRVTAWSNDGKTALCTIGTPHGDVCLMDRKTGAVRRLMQTPDDEAWQTYFLPGDTSVVFQRESDEMRIVTVDVAGLMAAHKR